MDAVTAPPASVTPAACPRPRRGLRPAERVELALIGAGLGVVAALSGGLAWAVPLGHLVAYAAAALLGQGLVRDLARLALRPGRPAARERLVCLCAESTVGVTFVALGLGLSLVGDATPVVVGRAGLLAGLAGVLGAGFVAKDYVLVLRRVEDHGAIVL